MTSPIRQRSAIRLWIPVLFIMGCSPAPEPPVVDTSSDSVPVQSYEVVQSFPHDPRAFTQGLQYHDGYLYESTGLRGRSSLRQVDLETGRVLRRVNLPDRYFGEGIAIVEDRIYQLTWQSQTGFIFDLATFQHLGRFTYEGQGWGLAYNGEHLIMSDGSSRLRFMDPHDARVLHTLNVTANGLPVARLNELAWIEGEIWANVLESDRIARIDPDTGDVRAWIDLTDLLDRRSLSGPVDVLNGIAYDQETQRVFVTGKWWPRVFEIRVK